MGVEEEREVEREEKGRGGYGNTSATILDLLFAAGAAWVKGREKRREGEGR